jgi:HK97 family phage major capsid protein
MKLTTPMTVTAADSTTRTISGRIVAFDEPANASTGKVIFAKGSIEPKDVLLNLEHDRTRRIGKPLSVALSADEMSIDAAFKIATTTAGSDALVEAAEGLRDGFSVELAVNEYEMLKDGTMKVLAGELTGVALVAEPAVRSARVSEVAATTEDEDSAPIDDADETPTPTEGDEVENTVTSADTVETVEAAQSVTASAKPVAYSSPRIEVTAAKYLENKIQAALGSETARQYVLAADNTTDNAGLVPTRQLAEVVNGLSTTIRPSIDAISRGALPDAGMTFEIPKITVAPTAAVVAEDAIFNETDQNSAFISVDVKKFAGQQKFSVELLQRTSPVFYDELLRNMVAAMAKAQDTYVNGVLVAGATADGTTITTYPTAAELLGFVARGAASVYGATAGLANPFARNILMNTSQWSNTMSLNDSGRPIYNEVTNPMNQPGVATPTSLRGRVAGLDLYVTANTAATTDTDDSILVINPDAYTWYEGPQYQLRAESTADGSITVGVYSFGACATKIAGGAFGVNKG